MFSPEHESFSLNNQFIENTLLFLKYELVKYNSSDPVDFNRHYMETRDRDKITDTAIRMVIKTVGLLYKHGCPTNELQNLIQNEMRQLTNNQVEGLAMILQEQLQGSRLRLCWNNNGLLLQDVS